ncbi:DUF4349 domain-containing protein [Parafilimonas sp.]|uniref:DUF4349 domain-containing protein n=1 Tax=Parafilimonas sp. TaxID=1969739 RepID=UPI0039E51AA8
MKRYIYCMAIFAMMLYACNKASQSKELQSEDQTAMDHNKTTGKDEDQVAVFDSVAPLSDTNNNPVSVKNDNADWDRKIIKTADVQLQLDDYKKFNTFIHTSLKQYGAYIAGENQQETDYKTENTVTIKVPVAQFDALVNSFGGDGIKITGKNISSEDVTGEVVDTKARMQAKMAVRDKYLQLLKQAKNMNEILQVQNEINDIQEDIEAANGRINYLQHSSSYSTINLTYYQYLNGSTSEDEKPDFFTKMSEAFSTGASFISNLMLCLISIWPLLLGGIAVLIYFKRSKLKKA